jgi:hypothetical protein
VIGRARRAIQRHKINIIPADFYSERRRRAASLPWPQACGLFDLPIAVEELALILIIADWCMPW